MLLSSLVVTTAVDCTPLHAIPRTQSSDSAYICCQFISKPEIAHQFLSLATVIAKEQLGKMETNFECRRFPASSRESRFEERDDSQQFVK